MFFRILSHAGLQVTGAGKTLVFDPWLVGSTYWRSWWNYPPVSPDLIASLHPDFIYLTHIHWDHFQGPSLRKFSPDTPVLIPGGSRRMREDLKQIGFTDVRELAHGERIELAPGFALTCYHFYPTLDSGAVVECEGVTLFNANDAKFMGPPLRQILRRHPRFDFVFRSHSSANSRMCLDLIGEPPGSAEDNSRYVRDFTAFAVSTGARYAIPFASNHCYLHRETYAFNDTVTTPIQVEEHFHREGILGTEAKVMVSGDSWSSETGFALADGPWFRERGPCLAEYQAEKAPILEKFYAMEAKASVSLAAMQRYFRDFAKALPFPAKRLLRGKPAVYVAHGARTQYFEVDYANGEVRELEGLQGEPLLRIDVPAHVLRQCLALRLFAHVAISKRIRYRFRRENARLYWAQDILLNLYENELLPLGSLFSPRFFRAWLPRWREMVLYAQIIAKLALKRPFRLEEYLPAPDIGKNSTLN